MHEWAYNGNKPGGLRTGGHSRYLPAYSNTPRSVDLKCNLTNLTSLSANIVKNAGSFHRGSILCLFMFTKTGRMIVVVCTAQTAFSHQTDLVCTAHPPNETANGMGRLKQLSRLFRWLGHSRRPTQIHAPIAPLDGCLWCKVASFSPLAGRKEIHHVENQGRGISHR